jgi:translation elongation factor EF-G
MLSWNEVEHEQVSSTIIVNWIAPVWWNVHIIIINLSCSIYQWTVTDPGTSNECGGKCSRRVPRNRHAGTINGQWQILEPVRNVEVNVPVEFQGTVMQGLSKLNAIMTVTDSNEGFISIYCQVCSPFCST